MKVDVFARFPLTPAPWSVDQHAPTTIWGPNRELIAQFFWPVNPPIYAGTPEGAAQIAERTRQTNGNARAAGKLPELMQVAMWAEPALAYLAQKATDAESRAVFEQRFKDVRNLLNEIRERS